MDWIGHCFHTRIFFNAMNEANLNCVCLFAWSRSSFTALISLIYIFTTRPSNLKVPKNNSKRITKISIAVMFVHLKHRNALHTCMHTRYRPIIINQRQYERWRSIWTKQSVHKMFSVYLKGSVRMLRMSTNKMYTQRTYCNCDCWSGPHTRKAFLIIRSGGRAFFSFIFRTMDFIGLACFFFTNFKC